MMNRMAIAALALLTVTGVIGCGGKHSTDSATIKEAKEKLGPDFKLQMEAPDDPAASNPVDK